MIILPYSSGLSTDLKPAGRLGGARAAAVAYVMKAIINGMKPDQSMMDVSA
jgi:hypothetical protein